MTTDTHKQTYLYTGTHADTQELAGPAVWGAAGSNLLAKKSQRWASKASHRADMGPHWSTGELRPDRGH